MFLPDIARAKFLVCERNAFVGHSFSEVDKGIVETIISLLTKLGIKCTTGLKAEATSITDKIKSRMLDSDLFVGIFSRREPKADGSFTTSEWVIEEKTLAITHGLKMLLFVEEGVENNIGGMQGDYEHIRFNRDNMANAIVKAVDYIFSINTKPIVVHADPAKNAFRLEIKDEVKAEEYIKRIETKAKNNPNDIQALLALADCYKRQKKTSEAIAIYNDLILKHPKWHQPFHFLAHVYDEMNKFDKAIECYQDALDNDPHYPKNYLCYGKCAYRYSQTIFNEDERAHLLAKAEMLLDRALTICDESIKVQIQNELFLVKQALSELKLAKKRKQKHRGRSI